MFLLEKFFFFASYLGLYKLCPSYQILINNILIFFFDSLCVGLIFYCLVIILSNNSWVLCVKVSMVLFSAALRKQLSFQLIDRFWPNKLINFIAFIEL